MNSGWLKSSRSSRQRLHVDLRILPALNGRASGRNPFESPSYLCYTLVSPLQLLFFSTNLVKCRLANSRSDLRNISLTLAHSFARPVQVHGLRVMCRDKPLEVCLLRQVICQRWPLPLPYKLIKLSSACGSELLRSFDQWCFLAKRQIFMHQSANRLIEKA
ncbi:Anthranilate phosphoribosyltransferase [Fusarium oxysporum f. sp. albedinis]|nr:Anthranilate phosphoribosyltransferase [Fusarium oxysporum f. sp. albedinis]